MEFLFLFASFNQIMELHNQAHLLVSEQSVLLRKISFPEHNVLQSPYSMCYHGGLSFQKTQLFTTEVFQSSFDVSNV